ncbi:hypothetical protein RND81_04G015800 [Saponaria officinalis]|uniref:Retrotransposon gag domain-containing protein n=1 Tax=Saponaria officinalis TaxID=3572 RepID=A0AAW1LE97_SAPOF
MSEERLAKMEEKLSNMAEAISILVNTVSKIGVVKDNESSPNQGGSEIHDSQVKLDIPDFNGSLNPEELLDWLRSVERVFEYKEYDDVKKFKVATLKFKGYASLWFKGIKQQRAKTGKEPLKPWEKLKKKLQKKFITPDYT